MSGTGLNDAERAAVAPLSTRWVRVAFVSTTLVLLAVHLLSPTGPLGDATFLAAVGGAAVMAWIGVLRRPRGASRIPVLIAAGVTASALGDLIWYLYLWSGEQPSVSMADAAYLLAYVGLAAALVLGTLVGTGAGARLDPEAIIDALTIVVVSVLIFWDFSIAGIVADTTVSSFTRLIWASYPVLDAILLAMVARMLMTRRSRSTIGLAFAVGIACWLVADVGNLLSVSPTVVGVPRCRLDARCDPDRHLGLATARGHHSPCRRRRTTGPSLPEAGHRDRPDPGPAGAALRQRSPGR